MERQNIWTAEPLRGAKWGSSALMVLPAVISGITPLAAGDQPSPEVGDVVLAEVEELGAHATLEGREGQKQRLYPGDRIVGVLGHRYAPDQFEAIVPTDLSECQLIASGGVAGNVLTRRSGVRAPTQIKPLGVLADRAGFKDREYHLRHRPRHVGTGPRLFHRCAAG